MVSHLSRSLKSLSSSLFHRILPAPLAPLTPPDVPVGPFDCPRSQPLAQPDAPLPAFVAACPVAQSFRTLLAPLGWASFPERPSDRAWPDQQPALRASFVAAYLVKLHQHHATMGALRSFLILHPALVWLLGFELVADPSAPFGFDVARSVPSRRQLSRVLRTLSNDACQFLLDSSVELIRAALPPDLAAAFADTVAGDTKHILAWVKQNNPKQFITHGRFDPECQPTGDPDCKLGVKKRRNRSPATDTAPPTPTTDAVAPAHKRSAAEYYWGYASGVVATIIPDLGEVVLAERTRPFNESDISYFFPLMQQVERRLGRRPRFGAWDCAFDAHYVYDYFDVAGGFAAVPFNPGPRGADRQFAADGTPLCAASLPMTLQFTFQHRADLVAHTREKFRCPLLHPKVTAACCPIGDRHWEAGGCTTTIAQGRGSRIRHTLDRQSATYRAVFKQRTVCERVNSQAVEHGIERPKLRNQRSIANQNTLLYVLLNLETLQRVQARLTAQAEAGPDERAYALTA